MTELSSLFLNQVFRRYEVDYLISDQRFEFSQKAADDILRFANYCNHIFPPTIKNITEIVPKDDHPEWHLAFCSARLCKLIGFIEIGNILGVLPDIRSLPEGNAIHLFLNDESKPIRLLERELDLPLVTMQRSRLNGYEFYNYSFSDENYSTFCTFTDLDIWIDPDRDFSFFRGNAERLLPFVQSNFAPTNGIEQPDLDKVLEQGTEEGANIGNFDFELLRGFANNFRFNDSLLFQLKHSEPMVSSAIWHFFKNLYHAHSPVWRLMDRKNILTKDPGNALEKLELERREDYVNELCEFEARIQVFEEISKYSFQNPVSEIAAELRKEGYSAKYDACLQLSRKAGTKGHIEGAALDWQSDVLTAIASRVPLGVYRELLAATVRIPEERVRARALVSLLGSLPADLQHSMFMGINSIREEAPWAFAFSALISGLDTDAIMHVYKMAQALSDNSTRTRALVAIAPHLPEGVRNQALQDILAGLKKETYSPGPRYRTLISLLAALLDTELQDNAQQQKAVKDLA